MSQVMQVLVACFVSLVFGNYQRQNYIFKGHVEYSDRLCCFKEILASSDTNILLHCASECSTLYPQCQAIVICTQRQNNLCRMCSLKNPIFTMDRTNSCRLIQLESNETKSYSKEMFVNVARDKPTTSSSVFDSMSYLYGSQLAVDGLLSDFPINYTHTDQENSPWWKIDLEQNYIIQKLKIYNRADSNGERLHDVIIKTGPTSESFPVVCGMFEGPGKTNQTVEIMCNNGTVGRFVLVQIAGKPGEKNYLQLNEVEVFAKELC